ncbi:hypothetical protein G6F50_017498 [Rhizopus delemar]|uniref:Uncharacterized protein n=1 Tax=Rhizopus delemar TaxID=936053 RepID=A0A9P7C0H6_9FUNG|nr:hypothetical protein G6F50_017498 [Rhizopus delemar]
MAHFSQFLDLTVSSFPRALNVDSNYILPENFPGVRRAVHSHGLASTSSASPILPDRSEKLLIRTDPSGNRATTSSCPPIASMWLRSVEMYMSVRFSILAMDGCCTCNISARTFWDSPRA